MQPAAKFGQEEYFYELFCGVLSPEVRNRFERFNATTVLDIGCGHGNGLWTLYYTFGIKGLFGFDHATERNILDVAGQNVYGDMIDYWLANFTQAAPGDAIPPITSREGYTGVANLAYGIPPPFDAWPREFDVVLCSQVLHYQVDGRGVRDMLRYIKQKKHSESLVYISMKDGFKRQDGPVVDSQTLLDLCSDACGDLGITHTIGRESNAQGRIHILTNF